MHHIERRLVLALVLITQYACSMNHLPRNMSLKAFDPHRAEFTCKHEANAVPPIDPEAEQWLQEGLALTSWTLWPDQRDYKKAVQLWQQAADRKHWKAMLNLANAYAEGEGVVRDTERAVQIVEAAMKLGIPGAYDLMGSYHMNGVGVKQDASRAYAFWELAADMGSPSAQGYLGKAMRATYDDPSQGFWGNRKIGLKMMECGFSQGNGDSAFALGVTLVGTDTSLDEDNARALRVLHDGVKFGSAESAGWLSGAFNSGEPIVNNIKDRARAERYSTLADALERDPDLRLPNLDKVLPLPPAELPKWDGQRQTLVDAAKAVVPKPPPPKPASNAASQRTGRAHIPEGWTLPEKPQVEVMAQYETVSAPETGYWIARLLRPVTDRHHAWNADQVPMRYKKGELFDRTRPNLRPEDGRMQFHYLGELVAQPEPKLPDEDPRVARGIARYGDVPKLSVECRGSATCPQTGVWTASVADEHPLSAVFNQWYAQAYVDQGQKFPDPKDQHLDIASREVTWRWLSSANETRAPGLVYIRVSEPAARNPGAEPTSASSDAAANDSIAAEPARLPLGELAATGCACPQTGWWQCAEASAPVQGGKRQFFRNGATMPHAVLLGEPSFWQKLKGERPSHKSATVWTLVSYDEPPVPLATAAETTPSPDTGATPPTGNA